MLVLVRESDLVLDQGLVQEWVLLLGLGWVLELGQEWELELVLVWGQVLGQE